MRPQPSFDPYRTLGVTRQATRQEIARAHRKLAKGAHPDLHGPDAAARMQAINRAWSLLSDPVRRADWDAMHPATPVVAHWMGPNQPAVAPARTRAWEGMPPPATWSASAAPPAAGYVRRDRVAAAPAPPADLPRSMRDSGWLAAAVAGALVIAAILLGWVATMDRTALSLDEAVSLAGIGGGSQVRLDSGNAVVVHDVPGGSLGITHFFQRPDGTWDWGLATAVAVSGPESVSFLLRDPADVPARWNAFVFGRARPVVDRVELQDLSGTGGEVFDGMWAIGLEELALDREDVEWRFLADDGRVLLFGAGEYGS